MNIHGILSVIMNVAVISYVCEGGYELPWHISVDLSFELFRRLQFLLVLVCVENVSCCKHSEINLRN